MSPASHLIPPEPLPVTKPFPHCHCHPHILAGFFSFFGSALKFHFLGVGALTSLAHLGFPGAFITLFMFSLATVSYKRTVLWVVVYIIAASGPHKRLSTARWQRLRSRCQAREVFAEYVLKEGRKEGKTG